MRTRLITLDVPEPLLAALEQAAHHRAVSLGALMRDVLAQNLPDRGAPGAARPRARASAAPDHEDFEVIDRFDSPPPPGPAAPPP